MIEKFNGIFYLIVFLAHFIGIATYCFQTIVGTKNFMDKFGIDYSAATVVRFVGALMLGWVIMAIYIMFIRPNGVDGTWAFFNLIFIIHFCVMLTNFYSIKIDKTGMNEKNQSNEGIIAPAVFLILMGILCYGLSDKIYII
tara:strand:+ start:56 stop:478 length:423 start_codon:yes stop_codon:yes gene_type:complete